MSNDLDYVIIKELEMKPEKLESLIEKMGEIAYDLEVEFDYNSDEKNNQKNKKETVDGKEEMMTIECWDFYFERNEKTKDYFLKKIERNDRWWDLKWWHTSVLYTVILRMNAKILWVAIDEGWNGFMFKVHKGKIEVKEFPFYETLKKAIIWNEEFKVIKQKRVREFYFEAK